MDRGNDKLDDVELELYAVVAARLKQAHARVRALHATDEVHIALVRKLLVITASAKHDLADAARRLERLMSDLDEGLDDRG